MECSSLLVQILLPMATSANDKRGFDKVLQQLTAEFGGATAFLNSPAQGIWDDGGQLDEDRIVTVEVMVDDLDEAWWRHYRLALEAEFRQKEIVIRAIPIKRI
jgi:hypothetical protein